jgi:TolB-like protein
MKTIRKSANATIEQSGTLEEPDIRRQLDRVLNSQGFLSSPRLCSFLSYVSEKKIIGEATKIKQYSIGVDVYGRELDFDPKTDPLIRIEAGRLRRKLREYYENQGKDDPVHVEIPRGNYVPNFSLPPQSLERQAVVDRTGPKLRQKLTSPVVAVFPFVNNAGEQYEYIVTGLGTEIVDELSRTPDIEVLPYYTTARFKNGVDILAEDIRSLDIDFAVTGTLRLKGNQMCINVQLIEVLSQKQLWSDRFDQRIDFNKIEDLEDIVVSNVLGKIADQHGIINREMSSRLPRENMDPSTYEAILRGHNYMLALTLDSFQQARTALEKAVKVEPDSATAWAMLSIMYIDSIVFEYAEIPDAHQLGIKFASIAISKDPCSQIAHQSMAYIGLIEGDRAAVEHSARRMIAINDNAASMIAAAGFWLCLAGQYDEGMKWFNRGIALNPYYPGWLHAAPYFYHMQAGEFELALQHAQDFGMPDFFWSSLMKASALGLLGRSDEAARSYSCLLELMPNFETISRSCVSSFVLDESLTDTILRGLKKAGMLESEN